MVPNCARASNVYALLGLDQVLSEPFTCRRLCRPSIFALSGRITSNELSRAVPFSPEKGLLHAGELRLGFSSVPAGRDGSSTALFRVLTWHFREGTLEEGTLGSGQADNHSSCGQQEESLRNLHRFSPALPAVTTLSKLTSVGFPASQWCNRTSFSLFSLDAAGDIASRTLGGRLMPSSRSACTPKTRMHSSVVQADRPYTVNTSCCFSGCSLCCCSVMNIESGAFR